MRDTRHNQRDAADLGAGIGVKFDRRDVAVQCRRPEHTEASRVVGNRVRWNRSEHLRVRCIPREAHRQVGIGRGELQRDANRCRVRRNDLQLGRARSVRQRLPWQCGERNTL